MKILTTLATHTFGRFAIFCGLQVDSTSSDRQCTPSSSVLGGIRSGSLNFYQSAGNMERERHGSAYFRRETC